MNTTIHIIAQSKWSLLSTYIDFGVENIGNKSKFEASDHLKTSKYKNIPAKGYTPN